MTGSLESLNEQVLVDCLKRGEEPCFEQLVRQFGGRLLAVTRRFTVSEADAQDALQDTFLQVFRNIGRFEGRSALGTWLHRIAVNSALSRARADKRRAEESLDALTEGFDERGVRYERTHLVVDSMEKTVEEGAARALVRRAIASLPQRNRDLLLLRDVEGFSTEETATALGMSTGAVKTGLHRAREALKLRLARDLEEWPTP